MYMYNITGRYQYAKHKSSKIVKTKARANNPLSTRSVYLNLNI